MGTCRSFALSLLIGSLSITVASALEPAITAKDVDWAACRATMNGKATPANREDLQHVLGLNVTEKDKLRNWSAGFVPDDGDLTTFHYVVAFQREVPVGSIFLRGTTQQI